MILSQHSISIFGYQLCCCHDVCNGGNINTADHNSWEFLREKAGAGIVSASPGWVHTSYCVAWCCYTTCCWCKYRCRHPESFPIVSDLLDLMIIKLSRMTSESGADLSSQAKVNTMMQMFLKALSSWHQACSKAILFQSDRTLDRMMEGRGGFNERFLILQQIPPRLPLFLEPQQAWSETAAKFSGAGVHCGCRWVTWCHCSAVVQGCRKSARKWQV